MYGYSGYGTTAAGSVQQPNITASGNTSGSSSVTLDSSQIRVNHYIETLGSVTGVGMADANAEAMFNFSFYVSGSGSAAIDHDGINVSSQLYSVYVLGTSAISIDNADITVVRKLPNVKTTGSSSVIIDEGGIAVSSPSKVEKKFYYKVFDSSGAYKTTLSEGIIATPVRIAEQINMAGSQIIVGVPITSAQQAGDILDTGSRMDIYVADSQQVNGMRIFSGQITKIETSYTNEIMSMIVLGYGSQFSEYVLQSGTSTQIAYNSVDPSDILRSILDLYIAQGGVITYDIDSIEDTGTLVSYTFNANTLAEGIDKVLELAPEGWYYYVDQATNKLHFHQIGDTPQHTFALGRDINGLTITKNTEAIINCVYFLGGDGLYRVYRHEGSIAEYGLRSYRYKDERVTLPDTADIMANRILQPSPEINVELEIADNNNAPDRGYDIESVGLADMVKVGGTGSSPSSRYDSAFYDESPYDYDLNNVSTVVFQVTNRDYDGNTLKMSLSTTPPDISKRISDIKRNIDDLIFSDTPDVPTVVV